MSTQNGPQGTGLIPPTGQQAAPPDNKPVVPPPTQGDPINDPPPVNDGDDNGDQTPPAGSGSAETDALIAAIEERMQARFDRAVSKVVANLKQPAQPAGSSDPAPVTPPPTVTPTAPQNVPTQTGRADINVLRMVIRDRINDELDGAGKAERNAAKAVVEAVLPYIDLTRVGDVDEFAKGVIGTVAAQATELVKTGSDRKVAQLRNAGLIPTDGQPASQPGKPSGSTTTGDGLAAGQEVAKNRWPNGRRRFGQ